MIRVTCITPTTHERADFNKRIAEIFSRQDYPNREHLFDYGDGTIGAKRNRLCAAATGEIIVHLDSDDIYADDWISRSVEALECSGSGLTGLANAFFANPATGAAYKYIYPNAGGGWVAGATMCYYKWLWQLGPFRDIQVAEDTFFALEHPVCKAHDYISGFLSILHDGNTSPKHVTDGLWHKPSREELEIIRQHLC